MSTILKTVGAMAFAALGMMSATTKPVGCTNAQRTSATTVLNSLGPDIPLVCQFVPGLDPAQVQACVKDTAPVSDSAKLIADIIAALPPAAGMSAGASGPGSFMWRGVVWVFSSKNTCAAVWAKLPKS